MTSMLARVSGRGGTARPHEVWNAFIGLVSREPGDLLSLEQRSASLVFWYESEVQNGGHLQYFSNRGLSEARAAVGALRDLGAARHAGNLEAALALVPLDAACAPVSAAEYVAITLENPYSEADDEFTQLESLTSVMRRYLEANVGAFIESQRHAGRTLQQEVSALRREPNSHDGQNRADVPCRERKWVWLSSCSE
jgi:hypothetical protein